MRHSFMHLLGHFCRADSIVIARNIKPRLIFYPYLSQFLLKHSLGRDCSLRRVNVLRCTCIRNYSFAFILQICFMGIGNWVLVKGVKTYSQQSLNCISPRHDHAWDISCMENKVFSSLMAVLDSCSDCRQNPDSQVNSVDFCPEEAAISKWGFK